MKEIGDPVHTKYEYGAIDEVGDTIMGLWDDPAKSILRDNYNRGLNWESRSAPTRGASLF